MNNQQDLRTRLLAEADAWDAWDDTHASVRCVSTPALLREAAAQLGRVGGRASVDEVHAWAERHDITGQYLVAAYEDAAASQLLAGVPDVELLDRIFNEEIKRVSTVEFDSNAICRKFYGELRKRLIEQKPTPQPDNKESR